MRFALLILLPLLALAQACMSTPSRPQAAVASTGDSEAEYDPRIVPLTREQDASISGLD